ncbi:MAG TPA: hypothetical protein VGQ00_01360 [Candidatus Norongarragalinales archaeon]|jgi:hypothetical protein|nr:hypothetical protein [Candidatus Norongarragalinales archaeon]
MQKTPFLDLPLSSSIWRKSDPSTGEHKPGVEWWSLDTNHGNFREGYPYYGVLHGELISYNGKDKSEHVLNLAFDTDTGKHDIFSYSFRDGTELTILLQPDRPGHDQVKAMKIAVELLAHIPEERLKTQLTHLLLDHVQLEEHTLRRKIWQKF